MIQCSIKVGQDGAQNGAQDEDIDQTREKVNKDVVVNHQTKEKVSQDVAHSADLVVAAKQTKADDRKEDLVAAAKRTGADTHNAHVVDLPAVAVKQTDAHAAHAAVAVKQTDELAGVNLKKEDANHAARVKDAKADAVAKAPKK
jgi:hypothetical protein